MIAGFGLRPHQLSRDRYLELIISLLNRTSFSFALEVEADLVLSQFQFIVFAISCSNAKKLIITLNTIGEEAQGKPPGL